MGSNGQINWTPAGVYKGLFDGYVITANRHLSSDGKTAWHIRMYLNSGDTGHRTYWVVGDDFQNGLKQMVDDAGSFTVETGGSISNMEEKAAIVKAIAKWETIVPEQDILKNKQTHLISGGFSIGENMVVTTEMLQKIMLQAVADTVKMIRRRNERKTKK